MCINEHFSSVDLWCCSFLNFGFIRVSYLFKPDHPISHSSYFITPKVTILTIVVLLLSSCHILNKKKLNWKPKNTKSESGLIKK